MSDKMTCAEILESLSAYLDAELNPTLCEEIERHMEGCSPCVAFLDSLRKTITLYKFRGAADVIPAQTRIELHRFLLDACGTTRKRR